MRGWCRRTAKCLLVVHSSFFILAGIMAHLESTVACTKPFVQGAGISPGMLSDAVCPTHLPLLRVVDPLMAQRMATFVLWAVTNCQRKWWVALMGASVDS
jgi:hypothetical protein